MYKVFKFKNMSQAAPYMDAQVFDYINGCESESFEGLSGFDLIAFDFFDKTAFYKNILMEQFIFSINPRPKALKKKSWLILIRRTCFSFARTICPRGGSPI